MDRWFKRIWITNGVLIFVGLVILAVAFTVNSLPKKRFHSPDTGPKLAAVVEDSLATQDISLALPRRIGNSDIVFVEIGVKDLEQPREITIGMAPSRSINLLFCRRDGSQARLLLDRKAFVVGIDIPTERDTSRTYNLYEIVFEDTDEDGRLTHRDRPRLFGSKLDGSGLTQVLPDSLHCGRYRFQENGTGLVLVVREWRPGLQRSEDEPEQLLVYDLQTNELRPFMENASLIERARRILWDQ